MSEQLSKQEVIDDLLKDLPSDSSIEIDLPSECRIYSLPNEGEPVRMRPMTFDDEKILVTSKAGQDPTNVILSKCTENVNIGELLPMDKLYMLLKLREISYGDDYSTMLICKHCGGENPTTVQLSELNVNPVPDDFDDPIDIYLPGIKKNIKLRRPRVKDDHIFQSPEDFYDQLWRFILEIEGHRDKSVIAEVVKKLPIRDMKTITNSMNVPYGVDTHIKFECSHCKEVSVVDLPIDANFFNVS